MIINVHSQTKVSYRLGIEPLLSSTFLSKTNDLIAGYRSTSDYISQRENVDQFKIGIKLDAGLNYKLTNQISALIGISFLKQQINQGKYIPTARIGYGDYILTAYEVEKYNATFNYIGLPIGFRYDLFQGEKVFVGFDFSVTPNYLINTTNTDYTLEGVYPSTDNKKFVFSGNFGIFYAYKITDNSYIEFKPDFGLALTPTLIELSAVKQRNYYIGLSIGLKMNK